MSSPLPDQVICLYLLADYMMMMIIIIIIIIIIIYLFIGDGKDWEGSEI